MLAEMKILLPLMCRHDRNRIDDKSD
jgi:hypothetical protein